MIRHPTREELLDILREHRLTIHAFETKFDVSKQVLFEAKYIFNTAFFFRITYFPGRENSLQVEYCPNEELLDVRKSPAPTIAYCLSEMRHWLGFVEDEEQIPELNTLEGVKEQFFKELGKHVKDDDTYFTKQEAADLIRRIDELEQKLKKFLETGDEATSEAKLLKRKFTGAREDVSTLTKKKWKIIGGGKLLDAIIAVANSKAGVAILKSGISTLLGGPSS